MINWREARANVLTKGVQGVQYSGFSSARGRRSRYSGFSSVRARVKVPFKEDYKRKTFVRKASLDLMSLNILKTIVSDLQTPKYNVHIFTDSIPKIISAAL